jgi:hypothetical protein
VAKTTESSTDQTQVKPDLGPWLLRGEGFGTRGCKGSDSQREVTVNENERLVLEIIRQTGHPVKPAKLAKATRLDPQEIFHIAMSLRAKGLLIFSERCHCGLTERGQNPG